MNHGAEAIAVELATRKLVAQARRAAQKLALEGDLAGAKALEGFARVMRDGIPANHLRFRHLLGLDRRAIEVLMGRFTRPEFALAFATPEWDEFKEVIRQSTSKGAFQLLEDEIGYIKPDITEVAKMRRRMLEEFNQLVSVGFVAPNDSGQNGGSQ